MALMRILSKYNVYTEDNLDQTIWYMQLCYAFRIEESIIIGRIVVMFAESGIYESEVMWRGRV